MTFRLNGRWLIAWLLLTAAGCAWLVQSELDRLHDAFETDARIVHRLLSQRAVQHDAVLAMLALLQPREDAARAEQRLPSVYPQILRVQRRDPDAPWPDAALARAEATSRAAGRPVLSGVDFARGRYGLVLAAHPASYLVQFDVRTMVPWSEWPMAPDSSPVRVALDYDGRTFELQHGRDNASFWRFDFRKRLAAESQPFDVVAFRGVSWSELPWAAMLAWAVFAAAALFALHVVRRQRAARERAEALLRLDRVGRLNALGELAAGLAHELNQPLTAVVASTQAAKRLLDDEPPELATARDAMTQAAEQARRASNVVSRMRAAIEKPERAAASKRVELEPAVRRVLYLLEPEFEQRGVVPSVESKAETIAVSADPVALEQIVHNLLTNALHALQEVPPRERALKVIIAAANGQGVLTVRDSGPGIASANLGRIFEPFYTTREGGLGLGLSLCESLAIAMNGTLTAANAAPHGAELSLALPLAERT
jgi:signal transduction histidine kinase